MVRAWLPGRSAQPWLDGAVTVHNLAARLPDIPTVRRLSQSLAMLDAILCPQWEYRYYSYDAHWAPHEHLASMRDGSGDEYSIVFSPAGAFIRGFAHESPMTPYGEQPPRHWPGLVDDVPVAFHHCVDEPAFSHDGILAATVCLWRQIDDDRWHTGGVDAPAGREDPDGSGELFALLADGSAEAYAAYAKDYFEVPVELDAVRAIFDHEPLSARIVGALSEGTTVADLAEDCAQVGYPNRR